MKVYKILKCLNFTLNDIYLLVRYLKLIKLIRSGDDTPGKTFYMNCKYLYSMVDYIDLSLFWATLQTVIYSESNLFFHSEFPLGLYCDYAHLKYVDEN